MLNPKNIAVVCMTGVSQSATALTFAFSITKPQNVDTMTWNLHFSALRDSLFSSKWARQRGLHSHILDVLNRGLWVFRQGKLTTTWVTERRWHKCQCSWWFPENSFDLCVIKVSHWPFIASSSLGVSTSCRIRCFFWIRLETTKLSAAPLSTSMWIGRGQSSKPSWKVSETVSGWRSCEMNHWKSNVVVNTEGPDNASQCPLHRHRYIQWPCISCYCQSCISSFCSFSNRNQSTVQSCSFSIFISPLLLKIQVHLSHRPDVTEGNFTRGVLESTDEWWTSWDVGFFSLRKVFPEVSCIVSEGPRRFYGRYSDRPTKCSLEEEKSQTGSKVLKRIFPTQNEGSWNHKSHKKTMGIQPMCSSKTVFLRVWRMLNSHYPCLDFSSCFKMFLRFLGAFHIFFNQMEVIYIWTFVFSVGQRLILNQNLS